MINFWVNFHIGHRILEGGEETAGHGRLWAVSPGGGTQPMGKHPEDPSTNHGGPSLEHSILRYIKYSI